MSVERKKVSDPELIAKLNQRSMGQKVQNPYLIDQLNKAYNQPQESEMPDFNTPYGAGDAVRDLAYGASKAGTGLLGLVESLSSSPLQKRLMESRGTEEPSLSKYLEEKAQAIQSPNQTLTGDALKLVGEFGIPGGLLAKALRGTKAASALARIPFTEKRAAIPIQELRDYAASRGATAEISPEIAESVKSFLGNKGYPIELFQDTLKTGEFGGVSDILSDLGKIARDRRAEETTRAAAERLRSHFMEHFKQGLSKKGFEDVAEKIEPAHARYRKYKTAKNWMHGLSGAGAAAELINFLRKSL